MDRHHASSFNRTPLVNGFSRRGKFDDELSALSDSSRTDHEPYRREEASSETIPHRENSHEKLRPSPVPVSTLVNGTHYLGEPNEVQSLHSSTGSNETQKPDGRSRDDSLTARPKLHRQGVPAKSHSISAAESLYDSDGAQQNRPKTSSRISPYLNARPTDQADNERGSGQDHTRGSLQNWNSMRFFSGVDSDLPQRIGSPDVQEDKQERTPRSISSRSKLSTVQGCPSILLPDGEGATHEQEREYERSSVSRAYDVSSSPKAMSPKYSSFLGPPRTREEVNSIEDNRRQSKSPIPLNHRGEQDSLVSNRRRIPDLPSSKPETKNTNPGEHTISSMSLTSFASRRINETSSLRSQSKPPLRYVNGYTDKAQQRTSMANDPITLHDSDIESFNGQCFQTSQQPLDHLTTYRGRYSRIFSFSPNEGCS